MKTSKKPIYLGKIIYNANFGQVQGEYVEILGETYYKISHYDQMPPFFMTVVSDSDHWLFISSTGGLSAGRVNANSALFPYETEDKIRDSYEHTGSKTVLLVTKDETTYLWEPFSFRTSGVYAIHRNLYKNQIGNSLIFEEINDDLRLSFKYAWRTSDQYGFVRTAWLKNDDNSICAVDMLDGLQNILPYGVTALTQSNFSVLLDAYKRNELDIASGLGIFSLSSTLTDLAEPSESLKATTVWQAGLEPATYLLSARQIDAFRRGCALEQETDLRGLRSAFLVNACITFKPQEEQAWHVVADVEQDSTRVVSLMNSLRHDRAGLCARLLTDIQRGQDRLTAIIASADGLQTSSDRLSAAHHLSNVLFNLMRGGVLADGYTVEKQDLLDFMHVRNRPVLAVYAEFFEQLPAKLRIDELIKLAVQTQSADLERLCYEYLPLTFSRRHGDPSRPWNTFSINLKNEDGSQKLDYQGNWRDIFQNWEPLAYSYPEFVESMICKFLNATTADGYNPYRVTRNGIEWEVPEPDNPWANIGYWSDHQIIYLQKLLEVSGKFHPGRLKKMLERPVFSHANVPYKIRPYEALLADWYATIDFDDVQNREIDHRVQRMGTDGKLVLDKQGKVLQVTMLEKLLILLLAKLTNFVPEGGIWMNTQRPEWNDANNALVGKGLSMVTVYYVRRFLGFLRDLLNAHESTELCITQEVKTWFDTIWGTLEAYQHPLHSSLTDAERRSMLAELGQAGSAYRQHYYYNGLSSDMTTISRNTLVAFLETAVHTLDHTIRANKREDGLYHAYNILHLGEQTASVSHLYEMLEGQVAVLSSGMLSGTESLEVLQALRVSNMYREDQHSYMLYPNRDLAGFVAKNCMSADQVKDSELIAKLVENNDTTLLSRDKNGIYHFNGTFRNAKDVQSALNKLKKRKEYTPLIEKEADKILALFEEIFDHSSFTGRSGTFFAYEGLGSIYWHMVSKLLLATQESYFRAVKAGEDAKIIEKLANTYYDIRSGIGFNKAPDVYGTFPADPYSHTPAGQGAKQPGMTGQVKEEILTRLGEMGLFVNDGKITFHPLLLKEEELLKDSQVFSYIDVAGQQQTLNLHAGSMAYTFCQTPVVYCSSEANKLVVTFSNGQTCEVAGTQLDTELSLHLFQRDGHIRQVRVYTDAKSVPKTVIDTGQNRCYNTQQKNSGKQQGTLTFSRGLSD